MCHHSSNKETYYYVVSGHLKLDPEKDFANATLSTVMPNFQVPYLETSITYQRSQRCLASLYLCTGEYKNGMYKNKHADEAIG